MAKFDIDLVGKVGSLALIDKAYGDINYSTIARISQIGRASCRERV